jgi:VWFA-related protein
LRPAALILVLLGVALAGEPQESRPAAGTSTFPSAVGLVRVDVVVTDKQGRAVSDLSAADFALSEDGVPQSINSFESVSVAEAPDDETSPARPFASTNVGPAPRRVRTFVIVFDDMHLTPNQAFRAKGAVAEFLRKATGAGDRVTLIASGGSAWWNARMPEGRDALMAILNRLDGRYIPDSSPDRVTDFEAMRIEVYQDQDVALKVARRFNSYGTKGRQQGDNTVSREDLGKSSMTGIIDMDVRSRAAEAYRLATSRNKITLDVMARALTALAGTAGRKSMVLISQGFVYDPEMEEMKKVVEASLRSNAPVYFIDTRGLQGLPESSTAAFGRPIDSQDAVAVLADITRDAEGTEALALDTGGFVVKNSNDLSGGIAKVASESRTYYLIGYNSSDVRRDGKFRRIKVNLTTKRAGLKVRARRGYYAPSDSAPKAPAPTTDPVVARAIDSPFEVPDLPLRVAAYSFDETMLDRINVVIAAEIDIRGLAFKEEDGRFKNDLAVLLEAQSRDSGEYYRFDQKVEMSMLPDTRERLERTWYAVIHDLTLPPGGYQVKVVAQELGTRRVGSVMHDFEVPPSSGLHLSTPILTDVVDPASTASGSPRPVIVARRSFFAGQVLYCQFRVFGAAKDPATQKPRVSAGYEIRAQNGTVLKRSPRTLITPTSLGALLRFQGIALPAAAPGSYAITLSVRDEVANRILNVKEEFMIENPGMGKAER